MHPLGTLSGTSDRVQTETIPQSSPWRKKWNLSGRFPPVSHFPVAKLTPLGINSTALSACVIQPPHGHRVLPPSPVVWCVIHQTLSGRGSSARWGGGHREVVAQVRQRSAVQGSSQSRKHTVARESEKAYITLQYVRKMTL